MIESTTYYSWQFTELMTWPIRLTFPPQIWWWPTNHRAEFRVKLSDWSVWQYKLSNFQGGIQNWQDFWLSQRKLLNFENWCQKLSKFDFQSRNLSQFRSTFLISSIQKTLFYKMMPNFWQLATTPVRKIHWFSLGWFYYNLLFSRKTTLQLVLGKNLSNFVTLKIRQTVLPYGSVSIKFVELMSCDKLNVLVK